MFHLQGNGVSPILGTCSSRLLLPEASLAEIIHRRPTASPSLPHVPTYIVISPNVVVQRGPERRDLHSVFFGLQPPGHSRSRVPPGTDAPCPEWHVLAHLLRQSIRHLQAAQDLALRDLALGSTSSLGVRALLIYLISLTITNTVSCITPPPPPHSRMFVHNPPSCKISFLI